MAIRQWSMLLGASPLLHRLAEVDKHSFVMMPCPQGNEKALLTMLLPGESFNLDKVQHKCMQGVCLSEHFV